MAGTHAWYTGVETVRPSGVTNYSESYVLSAVLFYF
jgi:hypothetical protein